METNLTLKEENSQEYLSLQKQLSEYSKLDNRSKFHLSLEIEKLFENNIDKGLHLLEMNLFTFYSNSKLRNVIQLIVEEIKDTEQIMRIMYDKLQSVLQNYESLSKDEKDSITFLFEELIKLSPLNAIKIIDQYQELFYSVNSLEEIKMKNLDFIIENAPPLQKDTSMNLLEKIDNSIEVYEKPSDILSDDEKKIAKNILIIGETGVGKSSFINSFVCYLLGVQMYNKERFKMVNEKVETQTQSVTSDIISYTIRPKENICKCPIRLIDTPGFGDTRGEKVENSNIEKLSDYLKKEITEIHAIIFVFKSSTNRIHSFQTEIFNKMMNLFGKDAANNFTVLFTFRDVGEPEALAAVNKANLTFKEKFECNNSVFFSSINKDRKIIQEFWKLSIENYRKIISFIMTTFPTQIGMTKTMLKLKKKLVLIIEHLKTSTNELLERLVGFQKERNRLIENKKKLLEQPNFIEEVYYVSKKVPTLNWNLTCSECKKTCHKNCEAVNMFLWGCESFSWGYCITCNHS